MKNLLSIFFLFCFFSPLCSFGQTNVNEKSSMEKNHNLPPGIVFGKKFITTIDLSYKLNGGVANVSYQDSELKFGKVFLNNDLETIKETDPVNYNYYTTANNYFNSLSQKVKSLYTKNELFYVYVFDQKLKNQLSAIK